MAFAVVAAVFTLADTFCCAADFFASAVVIVFVLDTVGSVVAAVAAVTPPPAVPHTAVRHPVWEEWLPLFVLPQRPSFNLRDPYQAISLPPFLPLLLLD